MKKINSELPDSIKNASDLLDLIITMNSAAAYEQAIDKKPYQFLIEAGIGDEVWAYMEKEPHIENPSDITWGEALNLVLKCKYKERFFSDKYLLATIKKEWDENENKDDVENRANGLEEFRIYMRKLFE